MTLKPDAHSDRTVLLYSGGIDSYCTAALTNPDVLLHVNLGGAYGEEETQALTTPKGMQHKLVTIDMPHLAQFELPNHGYILPARNAFLALLGAQYGSTIYMASIAASRGSDKDQEFATRMTNLMTWVWQKQTIWNPTARPTTLELPVQHLTKRQLVATTIAQTNTTGEEIRDHTFSCYTPTNGKECGTCGPCGRKWAALAANNIQPTINARYAYAPYWDEIHQHNGTPPERTPQHVQDVKDAWNSPY